MYRPGSRPAAEQKGNPGTVSVPGFPSGMSGDTELFENPSNIKDLWVSEQKTILYIPLF
jgi:hypothetical protein